jgi:hypothetical protein
MIALFCEEKLAGCLLEIIAVIHSKLNRQWLHRITFQACLPPSHLVYARVCPPPPSEDDILQIVYFFFLQLFETPPAELQIRGRTAKDATLSSSSVLRRRRRKELPESLVSYRKLNARFRSTA